MDELVRHPKVLDAVESIIGPNILIYHLTSWLKEPHEPSHVSWHQDGTYFGLEPAEQITAWIALTDSTPEMGCIQLLPGSHAIGQRPHRDTSTPGNLLSRGQTIRAQARLHEVVLMPLRAGQVSLHHTHIVHCSEPNRTGQRRIGIGVSYIPHALPAGQRRAGHRLPGARPRRVRALRSGAPTGRRLRRNGARRACRFGGALLRVQPAARFTPPIGQRRHLIGAVVWSCFPDGSEPASAVTIGFL